MAVVHPKQMNRRASYDDAPGSPLHPAPDDETAGRLPQDLPEEDLDFLELNPTLGTTQPKQPLDHHQQTRFNAYVEQQQLQIQRNLVQSSLNSEAYGSLGACLVDIQALMDFIWLSVGDSPATIFSQTQQLLTLASTLLDAILRIAVRQEDAGELIAVLDALDLRFARLIEIGGVSGTEKVRMSSLANAARVLLSEEFTRNKIEGFDGEVSLVFERVLDETGIL